MSISPTLRNNKIRVVDVTGNIHTFAGTGTASSTGDGGLATSATIDNPQGVMTDANLNVYIADYGRRFASSASPAAPARRSMRCWRRWESLRRKTDTSTPSPAAAVSSGAYPTLATNVSMSPQKLAIDLSRQHLHLRRQRRRVVPRLPHCQHPSHRRQDQQQLLQRNRQLRRRLPRHAGSDRRWRQRHRRGHRRARQPLHLRHAERAHSQSDHGPGFACDRPTATATQPVELHFIAGDNLATTNGLAYSSTRVVARHAQPAPPTPTQPRIACSLPASRPPLPGARSTPLTVNSAQGNAAYLGLTGIGLGAGATLDPATQTSFGANLAVAGLATDNAGNVYVSDSNSKQVFRFTPAAQGAGRQRNRNSSRHTHSRRARSLSIHAATST